MNFEILTRKLILKNLNLSINLPPIFKIYAKNFELKAKLKNIMFVYFDNDENQLGIIRFESEKNSLIFNSFIEFILNGTTQGNLKSGLIM